MADTFFLRPEVPGFWPSIGAVSFLATVNSTIALSILQRLSHTADEMVRRSSEAEEEEPESTEKGGGGCSVLTVRCVDDKQRQ